MADDLCDDERIQDVRAFKIEVVICGLDVTLEQLKDRLNVHRSRYGILA